MSAEICAQIIADALVGQSGLPADIAQAAAALAADDAGTLLAPSCR
ncbi:MAG: hypothetical protein ABIQ36_03895 [Rhodanobacter sp.]